MKKDHNNGIIEGEIDMSKFMDEIESDLKVFESMEVKIGGKKKKKN
jgi:hypothetical protein